MFIVRLIKQSVTAYAFYATYYWYCYTLFPVFNSFSRDAYWGSNNRLFNWRFDVALTFFSGVPTQLANSSSPIQVIVFTYMRSGSSLVGDILQHGDEAFYVFEPLHQLGARNYSTDTITFVNGTTRFVYLINSVFAKS